MLFEAQMINPYRSPYQQHGYLEAMFAHLDQEPLPGQRKYLWCESDGMLFVRRTMPTNNLPWYPVGIPAAGDSINFQVQARCRQNYEPFRKQGIREARPSQADSVKLLRWIQNTGERIGLQIEDAEAELSTRHIAKTRHVRHGFTLVVANFQGFATVRDPHQLEQGLTNGIGDSKAFGLGFIFFWGRGVHHAA